MKGMENQIPDFKFRPTSPITLVTLQGSLPFSLDVGRWTPDVNIRVLPYIKTPAVPVFLFCEQVRNSFSRLFLDEREILCEMEELRSLK
jgi:hypothetical protein